MSGRSPFYASVVMVAPLAALYLYFLAWALKVGAVPPANLVGSIVFASLVLRLVVVFAVKRLRQGKASYLVDIFAADVLFMAALFALYVASADSSYLYTLQLLIPAWPAALLIVLPPLVIYRLATSVFERAGVSSVVPSAIGLFSLFSLMAEVATLNAGPEDLTGVSKLLWSVFLGGGAMSSMLARELMFTGIILYVALIFYATTESQDGPDRLPALVIALGGSAAALFWTLFFTAFSSDLLLVFGIPGLALVVAVWWTTRAR